MKNKKLKPKTIKSIKTIAITTAFLICAAGWAEYLFTDVATASAPYERMNNTFPIAADRERTPLVIFQEKTRGKTAAEYDEMWNVINRESSWKVNARNPHSTAKGLGQFIDKTFANYCTGDVMNAEDNLDCFVKLYPRHKDWWEAAVLLGYAS